MRSPTSGIPSAWKPSALSRAADSDDFDASTTVQPDWPDGHSAIAPPLESGVELGVGSGVVDGVALGVGSGVDWPLASGIVGVGVTSAPGVGVGATAVGVGVTWPFSVTWPVSSASWMIAMAIAIAPTMPSSAVTMIGTRQPGAATIRVPTAAPQFRHHSCSSVIAAPQRGQRRPWGCCGCGWGSTVAAGGSATPGC